jgi:hypothetical protein
MGQAVVGLSDEQAAVLAAAENFKIKTGFCNFYFEVRKARGWVGVRFVRRESR